MSRRVVVGCVAVLALAVLAQAAPAQAKKFNSTVAIDTFSCPGGPKRGEAECTFFGHVGSGHAKCKRDRKVKLFLGKDLLGADRTSDHGFWGVKTQLQGGIYHARVTRRVLRNGDICKGATSPGFGVF